MTKANLLTIAAGCLCAVSVSASPLTFTPVSNRGDLAKPAAQPTTPASTFVIKDAKGRPVSVPVADATAARKLVMPMAKIDPKLDPTLAQAATIAQERANAHSKSRCWRYVKEALLASGAVDSYPKTALAKQAGDELSRNFGFQKLSVTDPYAAPVGSVLVYTGKGAGHVEIRTKTGFVSDFKAQTPSKRQLLGVYAKAPAPRNKRG